MAWDNKGEKSTIFDGPMDMTEERDACGVSFIANTVKQVRNGVEVPILSGKAVHIDAFKGTTHAPPLAAGEDIIRGKSYRCR